MSDEEKTPLVDAEPKAEVQPPVYGTLEAVVQGHMTFGGKRRVPGDILTPEDMHAVSHVTLHALRSQNLIVLQPVGSGKHQQDVSGQLEGFEDRLIQAEATVERQANEIAALHQEIADLKGSLGQAIEAYLTKREISANSDPMALPTEAVTTNRGRPRKES